MNRLPKPTYTPGEIGRLRVIEDFLPPPDQLVLREENVKVTLSLSQGKRVVLLIAKHIIRLVAEGERDPKVLYERALASANVSA